MPCNRPISAYYSSEVNEKTGKRGLTFNPRRRYLGSDLQYTNPIEVPCSKCYGCKADQSLMWSIRAYHESQMHEQNSFITLTYDDENLPADGKIDKRHLQLFFKRLRRNGEKIRYFACGEYGGKTQRPHYHAIIFGKDWLEERVTIKDDLYTAQSLSDLWGKGLVSIAPVTMASICYVCGYVTKKIHDSDTFNLMSRRPGIGSLWLDKYKSDLLNTHSVTIDGREYPIPKRYLLWDETSFENLKMERRKHAREKTKQDPMDRARSEKNRELNLRAKTRQEKL